MKTQSCGFILLGEYSRYKFKSLQHNLISLFDFRNQLSLLNTIQPHWLWCANLTGHRFFWLGENPELLCKIKMIRARALRNVRKRHSIIHQSARGTSLLTADLYPSPGLWLGRSGEKNTRPLSAHSRSFSVSHNATLQPSVWWRCLISIHWHFWEGWSLGFWTSARPFQLLFVGVMEREIGGRKLRKNEKWMQEKGKMMI